MLKIQRNYFFYILLLFDSGQNGILGSGLIAMGGIYRKSGRSWSKTKAISYSQFK